MLLSQFIIKRSAKIIAAIAWYGVANRCMLCFDTKQDILIIIIISFNFLPPD